MNITKESTADYCASITIEITPEDFLPKYEKELNQIRRKINFPGFRQGKVPIGIIKKHYGKSVIFEQLNEIADENLFVYLKENDINIIGQPILNTEKTSSFEDLTETQIYRFVFDIGIVPEFDVNITPETEVEYKKVIVTEKIIQQYIEQLRMRHGEFTKVDTVDEKVLVYGILKIKEITDVKSEQENKNEEAKKEFTSDLLIINMAREENKSMYELLKGAKTNDNIFLKYKDIENNNILKENSELVNFLEDENIQITFWIEDIYSNEPAEVNEDFFYRVFLDRNIQTLEEFKTKLKENIELSYSKKCDKIFLNSVLSKIINETHIPFPIEFIKRLIEANFKEEQEKVKRYIDNIDTFMKDIKTDYIIKKIKDKFQIHIETQDIKDYLLSFQNENNEVNENSIEEQMNRINNNSEERKKIEFILFDKKLISIFKKNFTVKEVEYASMDELFESE